MFAAPLQPKISTKNLRMPNNHFISANNRGDLFQKALKARITEQSARVN